MENHLVDLEPRLLRKVRLCVVDTHELFNDKLKMYYLDLKMMGRNSIEECENVIEEWSYLLKNLESTEEKLKQYPQYDDLFDAADMGMMASEDYITYQQSRQFYIEDEQAIERIAEERAAEAKEEGRREG